MYQLGESGVRQGSSTSAVFCFNCWKSDPRVQADGLKVYRVVSAQSRTPLQLAMTMPAYLYAAHAAVLCARSHGSGRRSKHWISAIVRAHRRTGEARVPLSMCARTLDAPAKSSHGAAGGGSGDTVCATLRPLAPHALAQLPPRQQAACVAGAVAHDAVDARAALAELWRASTSAAAIARRTSGRSGASTKACRSSRRASSQSWRTVRKKDP